MYSQAYFKKSQLTFYSYFLVCALLLQAIAAPLKAQNVAGLQRLQQELKTLRSIPEMQHANWGFTLRSAQSGKVLAEADGNRTLITASTMKLVTTGAGLGLLGEDFTFKTSLEYDGELLDNGTLKGNLYIKGGGDPTLGSNRIKGVPAAKDLMQIWAHEISKAGIRNIQGSVVGDGEIFEENVLPKAWQWSDIGNYYGAGASGLNINENFYSIIFRPGKVDQPATILRIEPAVAGLDLDNHVLTGKPGSGDNAYIFGAPGSSYRYVQGTIPAGTAEFEVKGSLPDGALLCAQMLQAELNKQNINVTGAATTTSQLKRSNGKPAGARKPVFIHSSPPLKDIVHQINLKSLNLYAEAVLKMIGLEALGEGSTAAGTKAVANYWQKKGLNTRAGFFMEDGSGLSTTNSLTPSHFTELCRIASQEPYFPTFWASLPVAGISGTLANMAKGTSAHGNVRAKSGTLTRVMCYSGYVKTKSGELLCFSMMANKYDGDFYAMRARFEKLMILMAEL
jgi:serine-type D-Ala-D-Ala carboxypeptidase/endopeptidase (penicillin-binding protein 4)